MKAFHGSHEIITEINSGGMFGGLFGGSYGAAASHGDIIHRLESPRHLSNFALNYEIEGAWDAALEVAKGDERVAEAIMEPGCPELDDCAPEDRAEQGWRFQCLRGKLALKLGYTSVEMEDEHGETVLFLPGCTIKVVDGDDEE